MKYLIAGILLIWSLIMAAATIFCIYQSFNGHPYMAGVAAGLAMTAIVGFLATSAAFDAVKHW